MTAQGTSEDRPTATKTAKAGGTRKTKKAATKAKNRTAQDGRTIRPGTLAELREKLQAAKADRDAAIKAAKASNEEAKRANEEAKRAKSEAANLLSSCIETAGLIKQMCSRTRFGFLTRLVWLLPG